MGAAATPCCRRVAPLRLQPGSRPHFRKVSDHSNREFSARWNHSRKVQRGHTLIGNPGGGGIQGQHRRLRLDQWRVPGVAAWIATKAGGRQNATAEVRKRFGHGFARINTDRCKKIQKGKDLTQSALRSAECAERNLWRDGARSNDTFCWAEISIHSWCPASSAVYFLQCECALGRGVKSLHWVPRCNSSARLNSRSASASCPA